MQQALRIAWSLLGSLNPFKTPISARPWYRRVGVGVWGVGAVYSGAVGAQALDLYQAWQRGLQHDAAYKSAFSKAQAAQSQQDISRSYLLPQLSGGYQKSRITGWRTQPGMGG